MTTPDPTQNRYEVDCRHDDCTVSMWSTDQFALQCWVTWHIYIDHRQIWLSVIGDRYPDDPKPDLALIFPAP